LQHCHWKSKLPKRAQKQKQDGDNFKSRDESLSQVTIDQYINALKALFVIDDLPAWSPSLRSKTAFQMENGVWVVPLGCLKN